MITNSSGHIDIRELWNDIQRIHDIKTPTEIEVHWTNGPDNARLGNAPHNGNFKDKITLNYANINATLRLLKARPGGDRLVVPVM